MRPNITCVTGIQTLEPNALRVPGGRRPPCKHHYMKGIAYQCALFDRLKKEAPQKTPRDVTCLGKATVFDRGRWYCSRCLVKCPYLGECEQKGKLCHSESHWKCLVFERIATQKIRQQHPEVRV